MCTKICILGNVDNIGIKLFSFFDKLNYKVDLYRADEGGRGGLDLYKYKHKNPFNKVLKGKFNRKLIVPFFLKINNQASYINKNYDIVFVNGISGLVASQVINLPKVLIPTGGEINEICNPFFPLKYNLSYLKLRVLRFLAQKSLKKIDMVTDHYSVNLDIYRFFNIIEKVTLSFLGEDVSAVCSLVNKALLLKINRETKRYCKVFLFLSRLNYINKNAVHYKGPEIFIQALEESQLENLESGKIAVYMGKHGIDKDLFFQEFANYKVFKYIKWVDHLPYCDLLSYLSMNNAILFPSMMPSSKIGGYSGIVRDAYAIGCPMVNTVLAEYSCKVYGEPGPAIYVQNKETLIKEMENLVHMKKYQYIDLRKRTKYYGKMVLDYKKYIPDLLYKIKKNIGIDVKKNKG